MAKRKPAKKIDQLAPIAGPIPVTLAVAAELAKVTEKTLRSWIAAGMPVLRQGKQGRGAKTIVDLRDVLRTAMEQDALDLARTRQHSAQADKLEMENAVRRGDLADVNDVRHAWAELVLALRAKLLTMPTKLATQLTNVSDPNIVATRLRSEVNAALLELANDDVDPPGPGGPKRARPRRSKSAAAAAGAERQPVGGRESQAQ
jgi:phage terminase Nu1 subunit (DNA packaging protein)